MGIDFGLTLLVSLVAFLAGSLTTGVAGFLAVTRHPDTDDAARNAPRYVIPGVWGFLVALLALCGVVLSLLGLWLT